MMPRQYVALLLAVFCAIPPGCVRAARLLLAADLLMDLETTEHSDMGTSQLPDDDIGEYVSAGEVLLDLLHEPGFTPSGFCGYGGYGGYGDHGYGSYGYYGCDGGHPGYGDTSRESDMDFKELVERGAALQQWHERKTAGHLRATEYDVYGLVTGIAEDRMVRRVMRAEEQLQQLEELQAQLWEQPSGQHPHRPYQQEQQYGEQM